jgi:hypothetical protein
MYLVHLILGFLDALAHYAIDSHIEDYKNECQLYTGRFLQD